ncbi:MAG: metallophosphoesterase [Chloroflexi bacterium]|jgi:predicted MPP superfamily phosphohydrolase|nr:metallophosphoesterase [Chloroflexota bacterium]
MTQPHYTQKGALPPRHAPGSGADGLTRRALLGVLGGTALASLGGWRLAQYVLRIEPRRLQVSHTTVAAPLTAPVRLALISDIHIGPHVEVAWVRQVIAAVAAQQVDLVLLGGDYVTGSTDGMPALAEALAELQPSLGVYAVLGNHDYWTDADAVLHWLRLAGVMVLVNAGVELATAGGPLYLAGLDDAWQGRPDLEVALAGHRAGLPTVLLQHEPDPAAARAADDRLLLQLAGHTHGGQVRIPGLGAPVRPPYGEHYVAGLYALERSQLYVTRGIGVTSPPVRLNCPPELTVITLAPREAAL